MPDARLVAVCDPDGDRRSAAAATSGAAAFSDASTMIGQTRPDVVTIATPPDSHEPIALTAIDAGADLFCEKPFAPTTAGADRILAAASARGRLVAVNHEFREMPIFRAVIDAAHAGRDGRLIFAQAWQHTHMPPWQEQGWRGALARRTLFEAGVHHLDFLIALFGEMPEAVNVQATSAGLDAANRDAIVVATLTFSGGRLGLITMNRLSKGEPQYFEARVDCEAASYRASFGGRARVSAGLFRSTRPHVRLEFGQSGIAWREVGAQREILARNPARPNVDATARVMRSTFDAFRARTEPPSSGLSARNVIAVVDACYASIETGQRAAVATAPAT
jgi:predicted dehydrogenase